MASIYPIPTTRSSDLLVQQRLVSQMQSDQLQLLRIQTQLSTGRRLTIGSDDAPAALRASTLQRLLEQKAQTTTNLEATRSYLSASENAISGATELLSDIRALAMSATDTTTTETQRTAIHQEVAQGIEQLMHMGNQSFRGRYLFAGSDTSFVPFERTGKYITYRGDERTYNSYVDVNLMLTASVSGQEIFGGISATVQGGVDLQPVLSLDTRLSELRSGLGVSPGTIVVSDGTRRSNVDLSSAKTIRDVIRLIEQNAPEGRTIQVRLSGQSLVLDLDDAGGGSLTVDEVAGGTTAAELGIRMTSMGTGPVTGERITPLLRPTTSLNSILGIRAAAVIPMSGENNDLFLEAIEPGPAHNGVRLQFVDDALTKAAPGVAPGNETVTYSDVPVAARAAMTFNGVNNNLVLTANAAGSSMNNVSIEITTAALGNAANVSFDPVSKRLTLTVDSANQTQVGTLIAAINAEGTFTAAYDASDSGDGGYVPTAVIPASDAGVVTGNTGNSGGDAQTFFVHIAPDETQAYHVVAALQADPTFSSRFRVQLDGKDTTLSAYAGQGLVDVNAGATTSGGTGEPFDTSGLQIVNGGQTYTISFAGAKTVQDVLSILNGSPANVLAEINASGTGINVRTRLSGSDFHIGENGGTTATQLGVRSLHEATPLASLNHGRGVGTVQGTDFLIRRNDGVQLAIDISSALTLGDVIEAINNHPDNVGPNPVVARLTSQGNGLELVDTNPVGMGTLTVIRNGPGRAAVDLGLLTGTQSSRTADPASPDRITARDTNPQEVTGVFNSLLRLNEAIKNGDISEIQRLIPSLDADFDRMVFARADLGARQRGMDILQQRHETEAIELKERLSLNLDTDMTSIVSELAARQASFEASLRLVSRTFQLSLLNFL